MELTRKNLLYNFAVWSIVALFTATQLYLKSLQANNPENWWDIFKIQILVWWIWGIITPFVFWVGNVFRVDKNRLGRLLIIHLPIAIITVLLYLFVYAFIWSANNGPISFSSTWSIWQILFTNLFHWHLFIYMAIIGIVHANSFFKESKQLAVKSLKLEKQLLQSQLDFLKMQLQPHFLFNTLNGVVSSIHQGKSMVAADMVTQLAELLRISLSSTERKIVRLEEEINHVRSYLNIEMFRFKDLEVDYNISDELLEKLVPNFILQPLVENAIKHGISKKSSANKIRISAAENQGKLQLGVENEGPQIKELYDEGIGISNIRKRLNVLFGPKGVFQLISKPQGVLAQIEIPL